jgi:hypothetical protein
MTKIGFRLIRGVAILFALFVGFSTDVVPTAWPVQHHRLAG